MRLSVYLIGAAVVLASCSQPSPTATEKSQTPAATAAVRIAAPPGRYELDPNHSTLLFRVNHLGVSNYVARFTTFDAKLNLDPADPVASSFVASVDPKSVRTDYSGDYRASHPESPHRSWDEDLALSSNFLNAGQHPEIGFRSTRIERRGPDSARIIGDLTMLGQTHPVTLEARLVGSTTARPIYGGAALGVSATGTFKRSQFGMTYLLEPPLVGDTITIEFNGEFTEAATPPAQ